MQKKRATHKMPAKKVAVTASPSNGPATSSSGIGAPQVGTSVLMKPLHNLEKAQIAFSVAVEDYNNIKRESILELDFALEQKREELRLLDREREDKGQMLIEEMNQTKKRKRIDCDNDMAEYKRQSALQILQETKEIPILESKFTEMVTELDAMEQRHKGEVAKTVGKITSEAKKELDSQLRAKDLEHKSNTAMITAEVNQLKEQEKNYQKCIAMLEKQLDDQRQLTKEVAQASAKGAIQQTIGKV